MVSKRGRAHLDGRQILHGLYDGRELTKQIAGTLASVRKVQPDAIYEELETSGDAATLLRRQCESSTSACTFERS